MIRVEKSVMVHATREQVFAFIDWPEHQSLIPLGAAALSGVTRLPCGGVGAHFTFRTAGLAFHGRVLTTEYLPGHRVVLALNGPLKGLVWWLLAPNGRETLLTCGTEYELPPTLLHGVSESYFHGCGERELGATLTRLQERWAPTPVPD